MKKLIFVAVLLALVVLPAAALAQTEFTLGGYIKFDTWWDSSQVGKNLTGPVIRANDFTTMPTLSTAGAVTITSSRNHLGRYNATAQGSRFNFTIKGPNLWGAKTSGFIEIDFDNQADTRQSASYSWIPRLRHAFFRMDWAETQLLMGQYWDAFSGYTPDLIQDAAFTAHGANTHRLAQIRLTQKFLGMFTVFALMGAPYDPAATDNILGTMNPSGALFGFWGQRSATPQFNIGVDFEKDVYGKAAFYGRPRGLNFNVAAGWQRTQYLRGTANNTYTATAGGTPTWFSFGQNNYFIPVGAVGTNTRMAQRNDQYLDPWVVQVSAFIPIITTRTPNLAGTASITAQFQIGAGLSAFGMGLDADNSYFIYRGSGVPQPFPGAAGGAWLYDRDLTKRYGGYIQGQYYFNNEWYLTYAYGFSKAFGIDTSTQPLSPTGYAYATGVDQTLMMQEHALALYYRPIQAFKFGLQYSYFRTDYLQITTVGSRTTRVGDNHRVEFAGWFYF